MKFYHASSIKGLMELIPQKSCYNQASELFFSSKKENVLVYLGNPVKKFYETKYKKSNQIFQKFATYGFDKNQTLCIDEYYKNALIENYQNVEGFIYEIDVDENSLEKCKTPFVFKSSKPIKVCNCYYIENALDEILNYCENGLLKINKFENMSDKKREIIKNQILNEFVNTDNKIYKEFLMSKFEFLKNNVKNNDLSK